MGFPSHSKVVILLNERIDGDPREMIGIQYVGMSRATSRLIIYNLR